MENLAEEMRLYKAFHLESLPGYDEPGLLSAECTAFKNKIRGPFVVK